MTTARKIALAGITSPIDPTEVATEGFISGGNRVELTVNIAASSSMSTTVTPLSFVQMVVSIAASSSMDVVVEPVGGVVQVAVNIAATSSMSATVAARPRPTPASSGGGGGGG